MDIRPPLSAAIAAFGTDATVTPDGGPAVETEALWLPQTTVEVPVGEFSRAEPRRVLALPLDGLPASPRGSVVTVPEYDGAVATNWKVDAAERVDHDHWRVIVVPS